MKGTQKGKAAQTEAKLDIVNPNAGGIDIGASELWVSVPTDRDDEAVRKFGVYTPDLHQLADWLLACKVSTVAMESTGVYWVPVFEILEARGIDVKLVNARQLKHVPGRKSDISDCQWIQRLHSYGLLNGSFLLEDKLRALRTYVREREMLIEHRAPHIQHMQKTLVQMNVLLTEAVTDITGVTGLAIVRSIIAGERDPKVLAKLRHQRCSKSEEEIAKALTGNYRDELVFGLKQALALYDFYTKQIQECDGQIEMMLAALPQITQEEPPALLKNKKNALKSHNAPEFDVRGYLYRLLGVDLIAVTGISTSTAQTIIAEIGTDMTQWQDSKHFCSWLGLAPHREISGGKVLRTITLKTGNPARKAFKLAAWSAGNSNTPLGAYYRRKCAKLGPKAAVVATAHKLARIVFAMLTKREAFKIESMQDYDKRMRDREIANLKRRAAKLGFQLSAS